MLEEEKDMAVEERRQLAESLKAHEKDLASAQAEQGTGGEHVYIVLSVFIFIERFS